MNATLVYCQYIVIFFYIEYQKSDIWLYVESNKIIHGIPRALVDLQTKVPGKGRHRQNPLDDTNRRN